MITLLIICRVNGIEIIRQALFVGDYVKITDQSISIDTKKDLSELKLWMQELTKADFMREIARARKYHIKLIVLCEHGDGIETLSDVQMWKNPMLIPTSKCTNPKQ